MKLLFDENLSYRLVGALSDIYPGSAHVRDAGLLGASDRLIWPYAGERGFLLVSKDNDFYRLTMACRGRAAGHDFSQAAGAVSRPHAPESYR